MSWWDYPRCITRRLSRPSNGAGHLTWRITRTHYAQGVVRGRLRQTRSRKATEFRTRPPYDSLIFALFLFVLLLTFWGESIVDSPRIFFRWIERHLLQGFSRTLHNPSG